jgi:DNA-binding PadR family transcriptional regulator
MGSRKLSPHSRVLLAALLHNPREWKHGYDLTKQTGLKSGSIYPILIRLADRGLLETDWCEAEEPGRPRRHIYRLSPEGLAIAREESIPRHSARVRFRPVRVAS